VVEVLDLRVVGRQSTGRGQARVVEVVDEQASIYQGNRSRRVDVQNPLHGRIM
jgi:hypothetical protein